jgi:transcriptional regulator with XRE-family HTH domain
MTLTEKGSQKIILENFDETKLQPTNLNSKKSLIRRLSRSKEARERFVSSHVDKGYAFQIREMREHKELSQTELGAMVGMNQNAIHRLESPEYGRSTITTLKRLAAAFDVALIVRFVPFSQLINWVSGTPFVDNGLSSDSLAVPNYNEEKESGAFLSLPASQARTITVPADTILWTVNVSATHGSLLDQIAQESTQSYIRTPDEAANLPIYMSNPGANNSQFALQ